MKVRISFIIIVIILSSVACSSVPKNNDYYEHGPVRLKVIVSKPNFTECDGSVLFEFNGSSMLSNGIDVRFLNYSNDFEEVLGEKNIVELQGEQIERLHLNGEALGSRNTYLARIYVVHPSLEEKEFFRYRYTENKCLEVRQSAPGNGSVYFESHAIISSDFDIRELQSKGHWYF